MNKICKIETNFVYLLGGKFRNSVFMVFCKCALNLLHFWLEQYSVIHSKYSIAFKIVK